jgi:hypothetical protein
LDGGATPDAHPPQDVAVVRDALAADAPLGFDAKARMDGSPKMDGTTSDANHGCDSGDPTIQCVSQVGGIYFVGTPIAVDDKNVYWVAQGQVPDEDLVMQTPRAGGMAVTLAHGSPISIVSDGANVYWGDGEMTTTGLTGRIVSVPVDGGGITTLASAYVPSCIIADESAVYWTDHGGYIGIVPKIGGTATTMMVGGSAQPESIAIDATNIYWTGEGVYSASKNGGDQVTLLPASTAVGGGCQSLALQGNALFLINSPDPSSFGLSTQVATIPATGASAATVVVSDGGPYARTVASSNVYWIGLGSAITVNETSVEDGGASSTLATPSTPGVSSIAVASDGTIYWTAYLQVQSFRP